MTTQVAAREGRPDLPDGAYEGAPDHLRGPLTRWLEKLYTITPDILTPKMDEAGLERLATLIRIDLRGTDGYGMMSGVLAWIGEDSERLLDAIHYSLQIPTRMTKRWEELEILLAYGGSIWTATGKGLQRRVHATAIEAFDTLVAVPDNASDHLARAWTGAYGRNPHPASAWHHSIKAVEASLRPVVCPNNPIATLSQIIDELHTGRWRLEVRGQARDYAIDPLIKMLELVWPDPNRLDTTTSELPTTREEARAVVQLAVAIVQWGRDGQIVNR